jgi:hypothetical protein
MLLVIRYSAGARTLYFGKYMNQKCFAFLMNKMVSRISRLTNNY